MKKQLLVMLFFVLGIADIWAHTLVWKNIVTGSANSTDGQAPQSLHRYTRTIYLVAAHELSEGGTEAGKIIKAIGFNYTQGVSTATANGTLRVYLENTRASDLTATFFNVATYNKGNSWATAISTMTKVSDAIETIPAATTADFIFQNGDAFIYTEGALFVAFEWLNPEGDLGTENSALCNTGTFNTGGFNGLHSNYSATNEPSDDISNSSHFRPVTRFAYETLSTLPVKIGSFTAITKNNEVVLKWEVGTETNVNRYEVERSTNGVDFVKVVEVAANGSSNYGTVDKKPQLGVNYYRLKGIDNDDVVSEFKDLRSAKIDDLLSRGVVVYPNPISGSVLNLSLNGFNKGTLYYSISDLTGKQIQVGSINHQDLSDVSISIPSELTSGMYLIRMQQGNKVVVSKIVKQ